MMRKLLTLLKTIVIAALVAGCGKTTKEPDPQTAPEIKVSESIVSSGLSFEGAGQSATVDITANVPWTASVSDSWLTISPSSGSAGKSSINLSAEENTAKLPRTSTVKIADKTAKSVVAFSVTQAAKTISLKVSPTTLSFPYQKKEEQFTITSNSGWKISKDADWVELGSYEGNGNAEISITAAENKSLETREANIKIQTDDGSITETITARQNGADVIFSIDPKKINVADEGGTFSVKITRNIGYKISSMPDWVDKIGETTNGDEDTYTFEVEENISTKEREGDVVFCNDRQVCVPVTITQPGSLTDEDAAAWAGKPFWHKSLVLKFTVTWCNVSPILESILDIAMMRLPDKIELANLHGERSILQFSETDKLETLFHLDTFFPGEKAYPWSIIDYRRNTFSKSSDIEEEVERRMDAVKETERNYPCKTGISFTSGISGNSLKLDLRLFIKEKGDYKVTALLLEDNIIGYQKGVGADYNHKRVARLAITDILGDAISTSKNYETVTKSYTTAIPGGCDKNNLRVLVYVLKQYGKQTIIRYDDYGEYYADNAASAIVGTKQDLVFSDGTVYGKGNESVKDGGEITLK